MTATTNNVSASTEKRELLSPQCSTVFSAPTANTQMAMSANNSVSASSSNTKQIIFTVEPIPDQKLATPCSSRVIAVPAVKKGSHSLRSGGVFPSAAHPCRKLAPAPDTTNHTSTGTGKEVTPVVVTYSTNSNDSGATSQQTTLTSPSAVSSTKSNVGSLTQASLRAKYEDQAMKVFFKGAFTPPSCTTTANASFTNLQKTPKHEAKKLGERDQAHLTPPPAHTVIISVLIYL